MTVKHRPTPASADPPAGSDHRRPRIGRSVHPDTRLALVLAYVALRLRTTPRTREAGVAQGYREPPHDYMTTGLVGVRCSAHTRQDLDAGARPGRGVVWTA